MRTRPTRWGAICVVIAAQLAIMPVNAANKAPAAVAPRQPPPAETIKEDGVKSGGLNLPIPRFVSLRADPVNFRTGPGPRYPIDWVFVRRHLPVEVIGEFDTWRRVRDPEGAEGWVHQSMLSGRRTAVVVGGLQPLHREGSDQAPLVATLEPGVIVNIQRCPAETVYCRVEVKGVQGWIKRDQLWGVYTNELIQ